MINEFNRWISEVGLDKTTEEHFSEDVARYTISNKALWQRIIMIDIIDRHQLHQLLTFNCEGQWKQNRSDYLISNDSGALCLPKPALSVSFGLKSFGNSAPIPRNLKGDPVLIVQGISMDAAFRSCSSR
jgi:hypothetical protein